MTSRDGSSERTVRAIICSDTMGREAISSVASVKKATSVEMAQQWDSKRPVRVALVGPSIAPYAIPSGKCLANDRRLTTRHFFATERHPGRQWKTPQVPFPYEIVRGFHVKIGQQLLFFPLALPWRLHKFKPDVISVGELGMLSLFTYAYALLARVPVLIQWEGTPHTEARRSKGLRQWVRRMITSRAAGFLYYNPGAKRYLKSIGARGPFFPIPPSVDDHIFRPPQESREENVLLYVGQLIPRKGVDWLMHIFTEVLCHEKTARLWVAGDGPLKTMLVKMLRGRAKERVKWFGFLQQPQVAALYRKASVFVFPSLEDVGGMVLIEAAMSGLPIVTSPFAGYSETVVISGGNGFIVDPRRPKLFARAILKVLRSKDKQKMYETSLAIAKRHTPKQTAEHLIRAVLATVNTRVNTGAVEAQKS